MAGTFTVTRGGNLPDSSGKADFYTLVDSATVTTTNLDQENIATNYGLIYRASSAPSDTDAMWFDTNNNTLKIYTGSAWKVMGLGVLLTNKSGASRSAGDVVICSTSTNSSFTTTTTLGDTTVVGVVAETIANDASGVVIISGSTTITMDGTTTRGQFIRCSATAGKGNPSTTQVAGCFAIALTAVTGAGTVTGLLMGTGGGAGSSNMGSICWELPCSAWVGTNFGRIYAPKSGTISKVKIYATTAPTGADLKVDVNINGTTIFTTQANRPTIAATEHSDDSGTPDVTAIAEGDIISYDIDQVGSTVAGGTSLMVSVVIS